MKRWFWEWLLGNLAWTFLLFLLNSLWKKFAGKLLFVFQAICGFVLGMLLFTSVGGMTYAYLPAKYFDDGDKSMIAAFAATLAPCCCTLVLFCLGDGFDLDRKTKWFKSFSQAVFWFSLIPVLLMALIFLWAVLAAIYHGLLSLFRT